MAAAAVKTWSSSRPSTPGAWGRRTDGPADRRTASSVSSACSRAHSSWSTADARSIAPAIIAFHEVYGVRSTNGLVRSSRAAPSFAIAVSSSDSISVTSLLRSSASSSVVRARKSTLRAGSWGISPEVPMPNRRAATSSSSGVEHRGHLLAGPGEVAAVVLGPDVRILAGPVPACGERQLVPYPPHDAARGLATRRIIEQGRGVHVCPQQLRVVVAHLFEMRDRPLPVDAVAVEPAAQVIVDPAPSHRMQRLPRRQQRFAGAAVGPAGEQHPDSSRMGELGRAPEPAEHRIEEGEDPALGGQERRRARRALVLRSSNGRRSPAGWRLRVPARAARFFPPEPEHLLQHGAKSGTAVTIVRAGSRSRHRTLRPPASGSR